VGLAWIGRDPSRCDPERPGGVQKHLQTSISKWNAAPSAADFLGFEIAANCGLFSAITALVPFRF